MHPLEHSGLHWYLPPLPKLACQVVWSVDAAPCHTTAGTRDRHDQIDGWSRHRRHDTRRSKGGQRCASTILPAVHQSVADASECDRRTHRSNRDAQAPADRTANRRLGLWLPTAQAERAREPRQGSPAGTTEHRSSYATASTALVGQEAEEIHRTIVAARRRTIGAQSVTRRNRMAPEAHRLR
jgi:hypothetical protein